MTEVARSSPEPQDYAGFDETDRALVHALQIAPRASWHLVGRVLGISPVTAARRWQRLVEDRLAWVTCLPGPALWTAHVLAFIEVDCAPETLPAAIATLTDDPRVASIEVTAGRQDLVLTVFSADLATLSDLLGLIGRLAGVRGTRTHLGTGVYAEGAGWRLDALTPAQRDRITPGGRAPRPDPAVPGPWVRELLLACGSDGRRPVTELAQHTGTSPSSVRRRLARMTRDRLASFRCEVAIGVSGWPVSITYWVSVPASELEATARAVATLAEVRLCAAVTGGSSNLVVTVWLRSPGESQRLETALVERFPNLTVDDRSVALRIPKRIGWRLDDLGRPIGAVLIDLWHRTTGAEIASE